MQEICYKIVIDRCNQLQERQRATNRSCYKYSKYGKTHPIRVCFQFLWNYWGIFADDNQ